MDELFRELQAALADGYTIERELRGGGMARVFVAEERALETRRLAKRLLDDASRIRDEISKLNPAAR